MEGLSFSFIADIEIDASIAVIRQIIELRGIPESFFSNSID